jgi:hypothetical protein
MAANWDLRAVFPLDAKYGPQRVSEYSAAGSEDVLPNLEQGLDITLDRLAELNITPIVVLQPPKQKYNAPSCIERLGEARCKTSVQEQLRITRRVNSAIRRSVAKHRDAILFDPFDVLCDAADCPAMLDGHIAYYDKEHITASFARSDRVAKTLDPLLDRARAAKWTRRLQ